MIQMSLTRIDQIVRAARPLRYPGHRKGTMSPPLFIAAMIILHRHDGEPMPMTRFADLMQIGDKSAWSILATLVNAGYISRTLIAKRIGRGRAVGRYQIIARSLVESPEVFVSVPRRSRSTACSVTL